MALHTLKEIDKDALNTVVGECFPRRYFIRLSYNGANFHGWQTQPNAISVQQTLEEALSIVLRIRISVVGAGRTDTGVNAREMYAHFDYERKLVDSELSSLKCSVNRLVGHDIAVYEIFEVDRNLHARFSAVSRTYKYFISLDKTPFLYPLSWNCPFKLDVDAMNEAAGLLLTTEDFTSFAKLHSDSKTNICKVRYARWEYADSLLSVPGKEESMLVFTITADRFLRNMVRAVVGTLINVGCGKMSLRRFKEIIELKDRCAAGQSVPPQGLYLWEVKYPLLNDNN